MVKTPKVVTQQTIGESPLSSRDFLPWHIVVFAALLALFGAGPFFLGGNALAQLFFNVIMAMATTVVSVYATRHYAANQARAELIRYGLQAWRALNSLQVKVSQHLPSEKIPSTTLHAWIMDIDGAKWAWQDLLREVFSLQDRLQEETDEVVQRYKSAIASTGSAEERSNLETKQAAELARLAAQAPLPIKLPEEVSCPKCETKMTARVGPRPGIVDGRFARTARPAFLCFARVMAAFNSQIGRVPAPLRIPARCVKRRSASFSMKRVRYRFLRPVRIVIRTFNLLARLRSKSWKISASPMRNLSARSAATALGAGSRPVARFPSRRSALPATNTFESLVIVKTFRSKLTLSIGRNSRAAPSCAAAWQAGFLAALHVRHLFQGQKVPRCAARRLPTLKKACPFNAFESGIFCSRMLTKNTCRKCWPISHNVDVKTLNALLLTKTPDEVVATFPYYLSDREKKVRLLDSAPKDAAPFRRAR